MLCILHETVEQRLFSTMGPRLAGKMSTKCGQENAQGWRKDWLEWFQDFVKHILDKTECGTGKNYAGIIKLIHF